MSVTDRNWELPTGETPRYPPVSPGDGPPLRPPPANPPPVPPAARPPTSPPRRWRGWRAAGALAMAATLVAGGIGIGRAIDDPDTTSANPLPPAASSSPSQSGAEGSSRVESSERSGSPSSAEPVAAVAAAVAPAVVQIETGTGLGSGVIYDADGLILTAAHVVADVGRGRVVVRTAAGTELDGEVLGADPATDIAVVKVDPDEVAEGLAVAELALGERIEVGQLAVAVGSPFGLDQTVTAGVISTVDRPVPTADGAVAMLQTDAPINPGNSGGALADRDGRVIGINDAIASESGSNAGIGFAVPIGTAAAVAERLVAGEPVEFAMLGVRTAPSPSGAGDGALVAEVVPGSAADRAGLEQGDRVTALDGEPVRDQLDLVARVRAHQPGDDVVLVVERDGDEDEITVTLGTSS